MPHITPAAASQQRAAAITTCTALCFTSLPPPHLHDALQHVPGACVPADAAQLPLPPPTCMMRSSMCPEHVSQLMRRSCTSPGLNHPASHCRMCSLRARRGAEEAGDCRITESRPPLIWTRKPMPVREWWGGRMAGSVRKVREVSGSGSCVEWRQAENPR